MVSGKKVSHFDDLSDHNERERDLIQKKKVGRHNSAPGIASISINTC